MVTDCETEACASELLRILIVDDDPQVCAHLPAYFDSDPLLTVVHTVDGGRAALDWLRTNSCDVVLSDIHMTDMGASELLRRVKDLGNPPIFVAMTAFDTDEVMLDLLSQGASGYVPKDCTSQYFVQAIYDSWRNGMSLNASCIQRLVSKSVLGNPSCALVCAQISVTESESEILRLLRCGFTNEEIARSLRYAEVTVRKKISDLMTRFEAKNRTDLAIKTQLK